MCLSWLLEKEGTADELERSDAPRREGRERGDCLQWKGEGYLLGGEGGTRGSTSHVLRGGSGFFRSKTFLLSMGGKESERALGCKGGEGRDASGTGGPARCSKKGKESRRGLLIVLEEAKCFLSL